MSGTKSKLPAFDMKHKSYETYKFELECWLEETPMEKKRQGIEVLLSLPESKDDDTKTREHIGSKLSKKELTAEDGIQQLITIMDSHLKLDDLGTVWEKFIKFDELRRGQESIFEYISNFDIAYSSLKKEKVVLPPSIVALMLIHRAGLSGDEIKLVLTGLDYTKNEELF